MIKQFLTEEDARVLRDARERLWRLGADTKDVLEPDMSSFDAFSLGRVGALAASTEQAIFDFLNAALNWGGQEQADMEIDRRRFEKVAPGTPDPRD